MNIDPKVYDQINSVQRAIANKLIEMIKKDQSKKYLNFIYPNFMFSSVQLILH